MTVTVNDSTSITEKTDLKSRNLASWLILVNSLASKQTKRSLLSNKKKTAL